MLKMFFRNYSALLLSLAGALALSLEFYLSLNNKSLCKTAACEIVGKYLTISESLLVAAGAAFFWCLALLFYFTARYEKFKTWPYYLLFLALALDSSLLGFQFFTIQQRCILCISVAIVLATIALFYSISQKNFVLFTCFILIWVGGFFVHAFMKMPAPQGAYYNMAFYSTGTAPASDKFQPQLTLIMSMQCPHCLDVVKFLSEDYPLDAGFRLVTVDNDSDSLHKINTFLQQVNQSRNPFKLLKEIKESPKITQTPINKELRSRAENGLNFLSNLGITTIPVLISEGSKQKKTILTGSTEIIQFLKNVEK